MKDYKKEGTITGALEIAGNLILTGDLFVKEWINVKGYIDCAGYSIHAGGSIEAGSSIKAGGSIEAGGFIKSAGYIEAGSSWGILAGLSITATGTITCGRRIFAGVCTWTDATSDEDKTITCSKLVNGIVEYGILIETGTEELSGKEVSVIVDGKTYTATIN